MNNGIIARISLKNLNSHRWLYARTAIAYALLIFIVCLFCSYSITFSQARQREQNLKISSNYIIAAEEIEVPHVREHYRAKYYDMVPQAKELFGSDISYVESERMAVKIDSDWYRLTMRLGDIETEYAYPWQLDTWSLDKLLTENDKRALKTHFGSSDLHIDGRLPETPDEIALTERTLKVFGIDENVIGKTVSLAIINYSQKDGEYLYPDLNFIPGKQPSGLIESLDGVTVWTDLTVCGVISDEYVRIPGHYYSDYGEISPSFIVADNCRIWTEQTTKSYNIYSLSQWLTEEEYDRLTNNGESDIVYNGYSVMQNMELIQSMQAVADKLFSVVGGALGCSLVLMIVLMSDKFVRIFCRSGGVLQICGMDMPSLRKTLFATLCWVFLFAMALAVILISVGIVSVNAAIRHYYWLSMSDFTVPFGIIALAFAAGAAAVSLIALACFAYASARIAKLSVKDMLNTQLD